jgi:hypothetical protein
MLFFYLFQDNYQYNIQMHDVLLNNYLY